MDANNANVTWLAIGGMTAVTYFTRIGGLWLLNRVKLTPRMEAWLKSLPGAILMAIVAPAVVNGTLAEKLAATAAALAMWKTKNLLFSMIIGVAGVWLLRHWF